MIFDIILKRNKENNINFRNMCSNEINQETTRKKRKRKERNQQLQTKGDINIRNDNKFNKIYAHVNGQKQQKRRPL